MRAACNIQIDIRHKRQDIWCARVTVAEDVHTKDSGDSNTDADTASARAVVSGRAAVGTKVVLRYPRRMMITHSDRSITEQCVCIPAEDASKRHDVLVYDGCDITAERCVVKM